MAVNPWLRPERPLVIAHRGHSLEVPENTIEAYQRAIDLGADMIEADVNLTRDGELVMIHDWTLDRTTDGSGLVRDLDLAAIRELDAAAGFGGPFRGLRVPTTKETLELARSACILMCFEAKGGSPEEAAQIAVALADLLTSSDALDWAFMSGYDHEALARAKRRVPNLLLAPERLPDDVPPDPADAIQQAAALGAPVIQNHHRYLARELVDALHGAGIGVWSWPTTEPASITASLAVAADGVMGDDVAAMRAAVPRR